MDLKIPIRLILTFLAIALLSINTKASAGSYTNRCVKLSLFYISTPDSPQLLSALNKMCACQEAVLVKVGIPQADLEVFGKVPVSRQVQVTPDEARVVPRINAIINSKPVSQKCGSLLPD
jgi:hypothetical protein